MNKIMESRYPTLYENFSFEDFLSQVSPHVLVNSMSDEDKDSQYSRYQNVPFFDLTKEAISVARDDQLPEKTAYAFKALMLSHVSDAVLIGFSNPFDQEAILSIQNLVHTFIKPVLVKQKDLERLLRLTYRKITAIQEYADRITVKAPSIETIDLITHSDDQVSVLACLILQDAFDIQASDIHIEANRAYVRIRLRVDGLLQKYDLNNVAIGDHLVRYFKLLADVDITQEQKPSEGRKVAIHIAENDLNLRISFLPTYDGQSVVIRLLGDAESYLLAEKITDQYYLSMIREYLARSYGMFLISGPTGSGKTTTLYSSIQEINTPEKKIITLEDPVEAKIPNVNQIQINETIHYSFSEALRAVLRQDPDVIMVGEIRDELTANMAVRAAITGHLVLSTVHARGVIEIPIRLLNLNVDPYLLASALRLSVAQRLVRKICMHCKKKHPPTEVETVFLARHPEWEDQGKSFYRGEGCYYCQQTGFSQREAIFEILHLTPEMITCLSLNSVADYMRLAREAMRGATLLDAAFSLARNGDIPLSEVMRMESD